MLKRLLFFSLMLLSLALAQQTTVTVHLPDLLRLELSGMQGTSLDLPLTVAVAQSSYNFSPSSSTLRILATGPWQLMMSVQSVSQEHLRLHVRPEGTARSFPLSDFPQAVLGGNATAAWQTTRVDYLLANPLPAEGSYELMVSYSLVRP